MIPQLYKPTESEIKSIIARGKAKNHNSPELLARFDRAAAILSRFPIYAQVDPPHPSVHWRIPSAKQPDIRHYTITERYCTCPDYEAGMNRQDGRPNRPQLGDHPGAPELAGQLWCKHRIAIAAYVNILCDHMAAQIAAGECEIVNGNLIWPAGVIGEVIETPRGLRFRRHYDACSFSAWLAAGEIIKQEEPAPGPAAWPPTGHLEWQPHMTPAQFRRWLETGEIPALQPAY